MTVNQNAGYLSAEAVLEFFKLHPTSHRKLDSVIKSLSRKNIRKVDPLIVLREITYYFFSAGNVSSLNECYDGLIQPNLESLSNLEARDWGIIEGIILIHCYVNSSRQDLDYISRRGYVKTRLEGSLYELHAKNLAKELADENYVPKDTIAWRYESQIHELVLMLVFNKYNLFQKSKKTLSEKRLADIKEKYSFIEDNYYESNDVIYEHLKNLTP